MFFDFLGDMFDSFRMAFFPDTFSEGGVLEEPCQGEAEDAVNHPAHYQGKFECIDEMIALFGVQAVINFCACNVYKYRFRADAKGGKEDIAKAEWYMEKLMELNKEKDYDY